MKTNLLCLVLVIFLGFSCKKNDTNADSGSSQLWIKVDSAVPDFSITLKCLDINGTKKDYTVAYTDKKFDPNLKTITVVDNGNSDTWVLVYKDFDRADEIDLQTKDGIEHKAKGFEHKEKRLVEVISSVSGSFSVVDRDISIIEKLIWVN
jgi:hypothetical protein